MKNSSGVQEGRSNADFRIFQRVRTMFLYEINLLELKEKWFTEILTIQSRGISKSLFTISYIKQAKIAKIETLNMAMTQAILLISLINLEPLV